MQQRTFQGRPIVRHECGEFVYKDDATPDGSFAYGDHVNGIPELIARMPDGSADSFKNPESDMAVGYRNGWLAAKLWLMRQNEEVENA